jgi:hypothetical protein
MPLQPAALRGLLARVIRTVEAAEPSGACTSGLLSPEGHPQLEGKALDALLDVGNHFWHDLSRLACEAARHRGSEHVGLRDGEFVVGLHTGLVVPGFHTDVGGGGGAGGADGRPFGILGDGLGADYGSVGMGVPVGTVAPVVTGGHGGGGRNPAGLGWRPRDLSAASSGSGGGAPGGATGVSAAGRR